ncbi:MAG TPA: glycosyltransferase family 2 protein [Thermoanaerobacterales bacterium]|nr:glycosyltransferase family 2 protein [Thermoanaerobacterales bacterium]
MKITALIPAYNEEENIEHTISGLLKLKKEFKEKRNIDFEIIVIDDGSSDNTRKIAQRYDVEVLGFDENLGKGEALDYGIKKSRGDIVLFLDADLRESSFEAYKLVNPIIKGKADVTVARLPAPKIKTGLGLVKTLAYRGVKFFTGHEFSCPLSGQRAFKRNVLDEIKQIPGGYGIEVGMLIDILKQGHNILEVDVDMYHDITGRNLRGFLHRGKQFLHILKILINKIGEKKTIA